MRDFSKPEKADLGEITFMKAVSVGHINKPTSDEDVQRQMEFLNRCLQEQPVGRIVSKNASTFMFSFEDLPGRYEQTTYHIGWKRKPHWITD